MKSENKEYREMRCCMCPNLQKGSLTCPGIPGTPHPHSSPCVFVRMYIDSRGWKYRAMPGLGGNTFKARYQKPEKHGSNSWKGVSALPWRPSFDEAQADLNAYAKQKGWSEWNGDDSSLTLCAEGGNDFV